uniref:Integron gene cassette protein n=1 Tax=Syphacia muris TaxID=451379 RepID=A0A0N5ASD6_9BILA
MHLIRHRRNTALRLKQSGDAAKMHLGHFRSIFRRPRRVSECVCALQAATVCSHFIAQSWRFDLRYLL